ncbi:MAG: hypothetical protein LBP59_00465 [Planctomycetaceae bacterium]|nr:hypothetical protein [Planctomycetaceae bacterium]
MKDRGRHACVPSDTHGETPASQDRGRHACKRLYSTANERCYISTACLFAFRQSAGETTASQDRGRLACKRLYSTANERGLTSGHL